MTVGGGWSWPRIARRIRVPLGFAFALLYIWFARPAWWSLAAGGAIAIPGLLIRAIASGHVRKNRELTTSGPYRYTRNPLYLGSLIIAAGFALCCMLSAVEEACPGYDWIVGRHLQPLGCGSRESVEDVRRRRFQRGR